MAKHISGDISTPAGTLVSSTGGGSAVLQDSWFTELERYPIVDAVNGPITADTGLQSGDLSVTTGMRFIPWDAVDVNTGQPVYNYQGIIAAPAPANIQSAAGRSCLLNAFTPRWFNGSTGQYYNGHQSIRVGIASTRVVPVFWAGQGQIPASDLDMHMMVEHQGQNKHLSSSSSVVDGLPRVLGSAGSGTYRRDVTYIDHRYREHRFIMGPNCYFLGMWVDTVSTVQRPKNRPQLFVSGVDSWQDPQTVIGSGSGWTGRDYQCLPQCVVASFKTGMCWSTDGQGGTGEFNANGTSGGDVTTYNGNRSSAAWSDSRVNWRANWWSSQYPIFVDIGGWNDGNSCPSPYQANYKARVAARITKTIAAVNTVSSGRPTRFINVGIQPVDVTSTSHAKYLMALGQAEIPGLFPGVVIGHVPLMQMWWYDTTTSGPRTLYCNSSDHIHLLAVGDDAVTNFYNERIGQMQIDQSFMNLTSNANSPLVTVPTS